MRDVSKWPELLRRARMRRGLSRREVAARIGVSAWSVKNWELRRKNAAPSHADALGDLIGLDDVERRMLALHLAHAEPVSRGADGARRTRVNIW